MNPQNERVPSHRRSALLWHYFEEREEENIMSVRVLNALKQQLGEGPHWDAVSGRLLIVDIDSHTIQFLHPTSGEILDKHTFEDKVGFSVPYARDSNLLVAGVGNRLVKFDAVKKVVLETLADVTEHEKNGIRTRINDGKCDPYGRVLFGTMTYTVPDPYPTNMGKLYSYSEGHGLRVLLEEVSLSNGLAWSKDNKTLYYIDSAPKTLTAYDYSDDGDISNGRVLVDFKQQPWNDMGFPDGMTIDVDDNLWVCTFAGGRVLHIDSTTGKLLKEVKIPSRNVTSACFGGDQLSTLFVTTAGVHGVPAGLHEPQGGNTFAVTELGTKGRPAVHFGHR